jgi:hypothetical protein
MLDGWRFGCGVFVSSLTVGINGNPCVAAFQGRPAGCIFIETVDLELGDLLFDIPDNSRPSDLFAGLFERVTKILR